MEEIKVIAMIVKTLFDHYPDALIYLIIQTPYNAQVIKIRGGLRNLCKTLAGNPCLEDLGARIGIFESFHETTRAMEDPRSYNT